jgi:methylmalonyl-CoA/ethylmalonyl-CoA epimerase
LRYWSKISEAKIDVATENIMPQIKSINHVAVVVDDMEKSISFWRDALGIELHELRDVPAEKSQVAFLPLAGAEVELVMPTTDDSGIAKYLAKRGPGMHHICLEVDDIVAMMSQLKAKNIRLINEQPRIAGDGKQYAFIHPESTGGVLVELYQI